jgi:hypothetical protein
MVGLDGTRGDSGPDKYPGDPPAVDFLSNEPVTIEVGRFTLLRHMAQEVVQEAAHRVPVTLGQLVADELVDLVYR